VGPAFVCLVATRANQVDGALWAAGDAENHDLASQRELASRSRFLGAAADQVLDWFAIAVGQHSEGPAFFH